MSAVESPISPEQAAGLRILYADDMKELRDLAKAVLGREGHRVECVSSGIEALGRLIEDSASVDLLITDHHMPGMDGIELVQKVRARKFPCRIMVFCSALSRDVQDSYMALGVDRMLYKPVLPAELREVIREISAARK